MMTIEYQKIDELLLGKITDAYGGWLKNCIFARDDAFALAPLDNGVPVGYICVTPRALTYPLEHLKDAYIEVLGVKENYRRQGIGRHLVECAEAWAAREGFRQIRTHSDHESAEAIKMWYAMGYGLCPADDWLEDTKTYCPGYWVAKVLFT